MNDEVRMSKPKAVARLAPIGRNLREAGGLSNLKLFRIIIRHSVIRASFVIRHFRQGAPNIKVKSQRAQPNLAREAWKSQEAGRIWQVPPS